TGGGKKMSEGESKPPGPVHHPKHQSDAEELAQVLETVSTQIPNLIRGLIFSVFSEEAGRNMRRAAASYYKELKEGGIPDDEALKMTREYVAVLTEVGKALGKLTGGGKGTIEVAMKEKPKEEGKGKEKETDTLEVK
ncbi:hypothetical protein KEJ36_04260, partial [Candidatus Bathyarchaeota archaeon]|nr:hypothetical protein [Candidatus Bathyarchaeota archaeon]